MMEIETLKDIYGIYMNLKSQKAEAELQAEISSDDEEGTTYDSKRAG